MNYIKHLTSFFEHAANDDRLNSTHISLYMALFQFWNVNRFVNPISISRSELMRISKISAKATYHKVIKDLQAYGYIRYKPSYNPYKGSSVHLINFCSSIEQVVNRCRPKIETGSEQVLLIDKINITNSKLLANEPTDKNTCSDNSRASETQSAEDERKNFTLGGGLQVPGTLKEVKKYFEEQKSNDHEAEKFFNYFQSNGWKVGGRAPMQDWHAAARNWILNSSKYELKKPSSNLHSSSDKNYSEPL